MNSIGIAGASRVIANAASIAGSLARLAMRSPKARLPIWSWFCRKLTKAMGGELAARLATQDSATMRGGLALIDKAGAECPCDVMKRRASIVAVIAVAFPGQQHMPGVVIVVVPLRAIFAARRSFVGIEQACCIVVVLQHQMNMPAGGAGEFADRLAQLMQQRNLARLGNGMDRIEPQPIEAVFVEPIKRILDGEGTHFAAPDSRSRGPMASAPR